jgi:hypothetical protein
MAMQMFSDVSDVACVICLEVTNTITDCGHHLCRNCYIKTGRHPQPNLRKCPYCRKEQFALSNTAHPLTAEQRDLHYHVLLAFYNETNATPVPIGAQLKIIIFEYGLNRVIDQSGREIDYECPLYDVNNTLMGTLGEIRHKSFNTDVVNKFGTRLGTVDDTTLYYDPATATYWQR